MDMWSNLRIVQLRAVISETEKLLVRIFHTDSGRILETLMQVLPDEYLTTMSNVITDFTAGYEDERLVMSMSNNIARQIAAKMNLELSDEEIAFGAASVLSIVNFETLRRQGLLEYHWTDNIFVEKPSDKGFSRLTENGKLHAADKLLEGFTNYTYVQ